MKSRLYSVLKYIIGWPFSLIALFFIGKLIAPQFDNILIALHQVNILLLVSGVACLLSFYLLRSYLWYRLVRGYHYTLSFQDSCYLWATSELKRYIPGNIWSFLGRTILFAERGVAKKDIGKCLILEAEFFVLGSFVVSLLALPFIFSEYTFTVSLALLIIAIVGLLLLLYIFNKKVFHFGHIKYLSIVFPPFIPRENLFLLTLSVAALAFFGLGNYLIIGSFIPLHPQTIIELSGFFVLSILLGYLSVLTPAGFGVREGIVIWGLARFVESSVAAFASLFSRLMLIITELIFVGVAYLWHKTKNKRIILSQKWISSNKHLFVILIAILVYTLYFSISSIARYEHYYTGRFDLGNMVQTVWNTTQGRFFEMTNPNGLETVSRLAFHADFILALLAPLYFLWSDPSMLLTLQSFVVSLGAIFIFLIGRHHLKHKTLALIFALGYLLNPGVERANLYDFHAVTLATTLLLGTYYFYIKKQYKYFLIVAILAALCKEHIWLITGLFGVFLFVFHKKRIFGAILFAVSVSIFYFLVSYAIPHSLGTQHFALSYYSDFGDSPKEVIESIIFSPEKIINIVLQRDNIDYLKQLFSPLGYLSVLAPVFLLFAVPDLLINLLSSNPQLHQIYYQYSATITPFIFITAIQAVMLLKKFIPKIPHSVFGVFLIIHILYGAYAIGPLPGAKDPNLDMFIKPLPDKAFIDSYLAKIPEKYSVAASNTAGSHLSERENIYVLPLGMEKADMLVFLLTEAEQPQSLAEEKRMVKELKKNNNYTVEVERDTFIVFKKKSVK